MNLLLSIIKYLQQKVSLKNKEHAKFIDLKYWNKYSYYLWYGGTGEVIPIVSYKDKTQRCGNFFYAYPDTNLSFTFFASKGLLPNKLVKVSKAEWLLNWYKTCVKVLGV